MEEIKYVCHLKKFPVISLSPENLPVHCQLSGKEKLVGRQEDGEPHFSEKRLYLRWPS